MISIDPTVLIVMGEVIAGLIAAVVVIVMVMIKRQRRTQALLADLENRLKQTAEERQAAYENMLGDLFEEDAGEECSTVAQGMVEKENEFYGRVIEMYMKRNSSTLRQLDQHMQEFSTSYTDVISTMRAKIEEGAALEASELTEQLNKMAEEHQVVAKEIEEVRSENARLSHDLDQARQEIDRAMTEYSAAFQGPNGEKLAKPEAPAPAPAPPPPAAEENVPDVVEEVSDTLDALTEDELPVAGDETQAPASDGAAAEVEAPVDDEEDLLAQWSEALGEAGAQPAPEPEAPEPPAPEPEPVAEAPAASPPADDVPPGGLLSVEDEIPSRREREAQEAPAAPAPPPAPPEETLSSDDVGDVLAELNEEPPAEQIPTSGLLTAEEEDDLLAELDALGIGDDDLPELGDIQSKAQDIIELADDDDHPPASGTS